MTDTLQPPLEDRAEFGTFNRAILLRRNNSGDGRGDTIVADLEDDFHRFRVMLGHDGERVTSVEGEAQRHPWSACPGAVAPLRLLVGTPLNERCTKLTKHADIRSNCTHLFDIAGLAIAFATRKEEQRFYLATLPRGLLDRKVARLYKNNALALEWEVGKTEIFQPEKYAGVSMKGDFVSWVEDNLDAEEAEAASILRRCIYIGSGRGKDLKSGTVARVYGNKIGACHTYKPGTAENAIWMDGSRQDWTECQDRLLSDVRTLDESRAIIGS